MTTLQEYLNQKYPTKEERAKVEEIHVYQMDRERKEQGITEPLKNLEELDLSDYVNIYGFNLYFNWLTNIDFLNTLPNPENLCQLQIHSNEIQPTDIAFFSRFKNLKSLKIGTMPSFLKRCWRNKFYGSFESWKDLSKLESICIEATDVDRGLEYLPFSLAKATKGGRYTRIECSSHNTNAKCQAIQNELRPFNYDLEAWQLAHPEKMLVARPELFTNPDSKDKWLQALNNKIIQSKETLNYITQNQADKTAKIARLETQIKILEATETQLREQAEEEREIHQDSMKAMDNFYQQNPPSENIRLKNILQEFEKNYLKLNQEKQQKEQENKELQENIKISNKILEQECQPKQTKNQSTQTDLKGQDYEQQQKTIQELQAQINKLTTKK